MSAHPTRVASRLSFFADDNSGAVGTHLEDYSYLGLSGIVRRGHPEPGVDLTYIKLVAEGVTDAGDQYTGLDRFGRVIDQRWRKLSDGTHPDRFEYAYDRAGQKLYKKNVNSAVNSELYHANGVALQSSYDPLNRMTTFRRGTLTASGTNGNGTVLDTVTTTNDPNTPDPVYGDQVWSLDQVNNWSSVTSDGTAVTKTHNSQNQLTGDGTNTYGYDNNGNLTTQTSQTTNTWDAWNRAASIRGTTYDYDALGRRIKETVGGNSRTFFHSGWQVIETRANANTHAYEQFAYSRGYIDGVILRDRDADGSAGTGSLGKASSGLDERLYVQQDAQFNVTSVISTAAAVQERMLYDPYGSISYHDSAWASRASSSYVNNIGFTGRWHDATGMIYFRARYYEPVLGRFVSRDPQEYIDGNNLYCGYFVPNGMDPTGTEEYMGIGVSGYGNKFFNKWKNEDSGAWDAIRQGNLEKKLNIGHMIWNRSKAESAIEDWMKDDKSQKGGCKCKSIMLVAVSLGSTNAVSIASWFESKYKFKPRLFVMIEGVNHWTGPYSRMGTAEIENNYYVSGKHWPSGMSLPGATNVDLTGDPNYQSQIAGSTDSWKEHIGAEWAGSDHAVQDINNARRVGGACGH